MAKIEGIVFSTPNEQGLNGRGLLPQGDSTRCPQYQVRESLKLQRRLNVYSRLKWIRFVLP